jgi:hypothetical protein
MADLVQFPFLRSQYAGHENPLYVSDFVAANQAVLTGLASLAGLGPSDFAIFYGLAYTPGSPSGSYGPGVFYLNGTFYYMATTFNEGLYLAPNPQGYLSVAFPDDSVSRTIYEVQYALSTNTSAGATPQFEGNMNAYRLDLKSMGANIQQLLTKTTLTIVQLASLPATQVIEFDKDYSIFCAAAPVDTAITFDFTNAVPGSVCRLKFTYGSGRTLSVTTPAGSAIKLDSGDPTRAASSTNVMYFLYAGPNESSNNEVSYTISQV